ncbi:hypothetical protein HXX01_05090 [Candidatus Nomurabacteria bacterium]|nr:hypothetical protein [Candidatus Nomurabacteria bacterium]
MIKFDPPFEERETDDLIIIRKSDNSDWQPEAKEEAKKELFKRGLDELQIDNRYSELEIQFTEILNIEIKLAAEEDYSFLEKIWIIMFWPKEVFHEWSLKRDGYILKAKHRLQLIGIGMIIYILLIISSL